jgi:hypothetical protein
VIDIIKELGLNILVVNDDVEVLKKLDSINWYQHQSKLMESSRKLMECDTEICQLLADQMKKGDAQSWKVFSLLELCNKALSDLITEANNPYRDGEEEKDDKNDA